MSPALSICFTWLLMGPMKGLTDKVYNSYDKWVLVIRGSG
jgi:hypothetical protein